MILLAGGLLVIAAATLATLSEKSEQASVLADINRQQRAKSPPRLEISPVRANAINEAIRQLNLPWKELFAAIEGSAGNEVALLSLEPEASRHSIRITGEAKTSSDMVDFVDRVENSGFFSKAGLVRHEINESDRNKPFRFIVEAEWAAE